MGKGRVVAAGFDNGIVRVLMFTADGIQLLRSFKAHDDAISGMKYSSDLKMFVTASVTGDIFFFLTDPLDLHKYDPLCTVKLPNSAGVNDFKWSPSEESLYFGCNTGFVYEIKRPIASQIDNADSFLWETPDMKTWRIKIMEF